MGPGEMAQCLRMLDAFTEVQKRMQMLPSFSEPDTPVWPLQTHVFTLMHTYGHIHK